MQGIKLYIQIWLYIQTTGCLSAENIRCKHQPQSLKCVCQDAQAGRIRKRREHGNTVGGKLTIVELVLEQFN